jgi:hypothetical protein
MSASQELDNQLGLSAAERGAAAGGGTTAGFFVAVITAIIPAEHGNLRLIGILAIPIVTGIVQWLISNYQAKKAKEFLAEVRRTRDLERKTLIEDTKTTLRELIRVHHGTSREVEIQQLYDDFLLSLANKAIRPLC